MTDKELLDALDADARLLEDLCLMSPDGRPVWHWYDRRGWRNGGCHRGWTKALDFRDAAAKLVPALRQSGRPGEDGEGELLDKDSRDSARLIGWEI